MSAKFEKFLSRFEALTPAARSWALDRILLRLDSDPPLEEDSEEDAEPDIDREQLIRFERTLAEVKAYRAAQN